MKKKVLICDDTESVTALLKARLTVLDYEVITASTGLEGLQKAKEQKPDLIMLDILMPGMTGYEVVEKIKGMGKELKSIPIIVMSSRYDMGDLFSVLDIHSFIPKPFKTEEVIEKVKSILGSNVTPKKVVIEDDDDDEYGADDVRFVVLAGTDEFILDKVRKCIEDARITVVIGRDEKDVIEKSTRISPNLILCQYSKDTGAFDLKLVFDKLQSNSKTAKLPFFAYCNNKLAPTVERIVGPDHVWGYGDSSALIFQICSFLNIPV